MAICPACHTKDKGFFAPVCHSCNTEISLFMQCTISALYNILQVVFFFGALWLIMKILF